MSRDTRAHLSLGLAMVIVGSSVVVGKRVLAEFPVFVALELRSVLACLILVPLLLRRERGLPRLSGRNWVILTVQALCGVFVFNVCLLHGLRLTDAASAGVITSATPACMGLLAWALFAERPSKRVLAGIALAVAGVLAVNLARTPVEGGGASAGGLGAWAGNLLVLAAVAAESVFLLLRKFLPRDLTALAASTLVSALGLLMFLPQALAEVLSPAATFSPLAVSLVGWLDIAYYGAFVSAVAYLLWFSGIVRVPASVAGVYTGIMPVSSLTLSWLLLDEHVGWPHLLGCLAVLAGIGCISGLGRGGVRPETSPNTMPETEPEVGPEMRRTDARELDPGVGARNESHDQGTTAAALALERTAGN